ncbi:MAG: glycosyl transferase family 1 [Verrucomicrobiales bacterium]|nr:glycosyl transferase family 1 [Verrucomicrobiales bacterium]
MNSTLRWHLGLVVPPISGHLNPALSVARELVDRGHRVTCFGLSDARRHADAAGVGFIPVAAREFPEVTVPTWMRAQGELAGLKAMRWILGCLQRENLAYLRELPVAFQSAGVEGALIDQLAFGAASVAQHRKLPYVTLCNALPVHADRSVPPFATTWAPLPPRWEALRSGIGMTVLRPLLTAHWRSLNAQRRAWGLPDMCPETMADSPRAVLSQQPREFEFGVRKLPAHHHLTGPWVRPTNRGEVAFPFERLDGRPLIYASMGTLQNRIASVFRTIAGACDGLGAQLVIAQGARDAEPLGELPGNPIVVGFAPQLALLKRASLVITHAGLNTALETLAHGVPMVAIPVANDQPGVAARLRAAGAGELVPFSRLSVGRLRAAVARVLSVPTYRESAQRLAREIGRRDGASWAADVIEESLARTGRGGQTDELVGCSGAR